MGSAAAKEWAGPDGAPGIARKGPPAADAGRRIMAISDKPVMFRTRTIFSLWRVAAMGLLLYAAADVLVMDTGLWDPQGELSSCEDSPHGQHSLCSCSHFLVAHPVRFVPVRAVATFVEQAMSKPVSVPARVLDPPPRA